MGTFWQHSNTIERDSNDVRAAGAKAYFFVGGTTEPLTVFSDAAEASPRTHPLLADGDGRWPNVFIPFAASYDVKVTTSDGEQLYYPTQIPNLDPVEASVDSVDELQLLQTGDIVPNFKAGDRTGFVRLNGRTMGSATSGGTERANADTEDLFTYLWNNLADGQAAVSTGRGASAAADWASNKNITLPNGRAAGLLGLDDMGNSAAGLLPIAGVFIHGNSTNPGSLVGENTHTMTEAEMRAHTHTFSATTSSENAHVHTGTTSSAAHTHTGTADNHFHTSDFPNFQSTGVTLGGSSILEYANTATTHNTSNTAATFTTGSSGSTLSFTTDIVGAHSHSLSGTSGSIGSSTAFNTVHRSLLVSWYIKL